MTLGDSFTFGGNVSVWDNYPYALAGLLRKNPAFKDARVVNHGHCEFNSRQVVQEFRDYVDKVKPDAVVLLTGASDKWNLSGWDSATPLFLPNWNRGERQEQMPFASLEELAYAANDYEFSGTEGLFEKTVGRLRVARMLFYFKINLEVKYLLWKTKREAWDGEKLAALVRFENLETVERLADSLTLRSRYDLVFEATMAVLAMPGAENSEQLRSKVFFQWLAWAYSFQKRHDASLPAARMAELLARAPSLSANEVFMKYFNLFRDKEKLDGQIETIMRANISEIVRDCKRRGIKIILQTYPGSYDAVNSIIADVARREGAVLVDNKPVFDRLALKDGRTRYFLGDDHSTPAGYGVMAANVYAALTEPSPAK